MRNGFKGLFEIVLGMRQWGESRKKKLYFIMVFTFLDLILNIQFPNVFKVFTHIHPSFLFRVLLVTKVQLVVQALQDPE